MQEDDRPELPGEGVKPPSRKDEVLRNRLEIYKWLFYAAVFFIVVLIVARCAHQK